MALTRDTAIAKLVSLPLAFMAAGYSLCASQNTMTGLYALPAATSTPLFAHVFYTGAQIIFPLNLASVAASSYLAWKVPKQRHLWATAAATALLTLPWTGLVMFPGITALLKISESAAEQVRAEATKEHISLLKTWEWQNYVRAGMFLFGGLTGLYAALDE